MIGREIARDFSANHKAKQLEKIIITQDLGRLAQRSTVLKDEATSSVVSW